MWITCIECGLECRNRSVKNLNWGLRLNMTRLNRMNAGPGMNSIRERRLGRMPLPDIISCAVNLLPR